MDITIEENKTCTYDLHFKNLSDLEVEIFQNFLFNTAGLRSNPYYTIKRSTNIKADNDN
jgi:hypothetical protein